MRELSFRSLEIFVIAGDAGGVAKAARELGISAAGASLALSRLQDRLGIALFESGSRRFMLTDEGVQLLRAIREDVYRMQRVIRMLDDQQALNGRSDPRENEARWWRGNAINAINAIK